ncbi:CinA-like protein [Hyella patelloides LEGE 07179]|uniref:CinA-like protein n=1 Tax=Hyella patelloides LEGE 07179 TaxID=945734 RepID=A0A563VY12_9CYAN|nr:competence/damage-inducible protein A [Hyella patelloides]VEP16311.1 CinA-like protein [Hyella patelloides LEGE 07179]
MSAEIICIGTELLLGDILNTNCHYLAQELASLGIPHYYQTVVGDNLARIHQVIDTAIARSSILIFTGGLGPTPDDLTTEAIASFFNTSLEERPEIITDITKKFASIGRKMTSSNRKQALIPQGAQILPNPSGTAPGMIWEVSKESQDSLTILTFPGVPSEMKRMWRDTAIPFLKSQGWGKDIIHSQMLRFRGIGESALAEKVAPLLELTNPTVAPYASRGEVRLRVSAKAKSKAEAIALIEPVAQKIQEIAGLDYFGSDEESLAVVVCKLLSDRKKTLAVAESCTGGSLGAMLTAIPGSSQYFKGGIIAYANEVKTRLLKVNTTDLDQFGAVSDLVAQQMAQEVKQVLGTDYGISITGIAGPDGSTETKPVGLVYIGLATPNGQVSSKECRFGDRRERSLVRHLSAYTALDIIRRQILSF